jgi:hypothetical protein
MFILLTQSGPPVDGEYNGADSGSFIIDTTSQVIYEQVGAPDATVWTAEGAAPP